MEEKDAVRLTDELMNKELTPSGICLNDLLADDEAALFHVALVDAFRTGTVDR